MIEHTICNFRTLGGLPAAGGSVRHRSLFRAADLGDLGEPAARWMTEELGVRTYVDLRSPADIERNGPPAALIAAGVSWVHVPMDLVDEGFWRIPQPTHADWVSMYARGFLRHTGELARVLSAMAGAEGAVVFGCWVGKDRTGVAAALLLSCLGVPEEEIVADYARSTEGLGAHLERFSVLWRHNAAARERVLSSYFVAHPEIMRGFLAEARDRWGGLAAAAGIAPETVQALKARYVGAK